MIVVGIVFLVLLLLGVPLAFSIGVAGILFFIGNPDLPLTVPITKMMSSTQSFPLLAVPFFVLAGNLMNVSGITDRLMRYASVLAGHLRGGLAHVSIVLSTLMGGISGAAASDAAMEARILGPTMLDKGYAKGYSAAVIGLSSLIVATIPPGIGLILFGYIGEVSIGRLFAAGIVPGILMALFMMVTASIVARRRGYQPERPHPPSFGEVVRSTWENIYALIFPLLLIVGIRFGIFTPSEAGAFAVVYAFLVGRFVYKELSWTKFLEALRQTAIDTGVIMLIIMCAGILGYVITVTRIPQSIALFLTGVTSNPTFLLLIVLGFLLVAGMFMEPTVNTLLLTPIFLPIMKSVGVDPVHFGILMMTMVTLGSMTPPVGVVLYTVCAILDVPTEDYIKDSIPFVVAVILELLLLTFFPSIVLFLPNLIFGQ
ncbi:TRAP transporter large permease [Spirochaeta thermophila]|uniref:Transporter n=1 Tax=Winmispira thermophila (strain ATCC 49972 / DSM 6192 / RI 19.B1) TaxID=665571 RepID=E0RQX2_WINT6|nr:TRAP transporter large permease [Spirochaeta thermophila]ADN03028.1 transporter [Spirochaeta thermophila DSM 6192]